MGHRKVLFNVFLIFLLNLWISWRLLTSEYIDQVGSIEGTHIALGRWALENSHDLSWFPLWYGGIPWQNTYPPLHPMLVAALSAVAGTSPALSYHVLAGVLYSLGSVTLFLLALRMSGSVLAGAAGAVVYSLVSPASFLVPLIRHDTGGLWHARRLQALVQYGEGPHVAAMALLPVAVLALDMALEKRKPVWWLLAALALAAVPLTNWIGACALVFAIAAALLSDWEQPGCKKWLKASAAGVFAYAIASPWIPPSAVLHVQSQERFVSGRLPPERWVAWAATLATVIVALWALRRFRVPRGFRFSVLFLLPMATVTLLSHWKGIDLLPQARRYHLELEMAIALLAGCAVAALLGSLSSRARAATGGALLLLCILPLTQYRHHARGLIQPIDITKTIEYREARWLNQNISPGRVFAPGSVGFFLNVFTDVPQLGGGFDQGVINPLLPAAYYQILSGDNAGAAEGEVAVLWFKALGVDAAAVSGPGSDEYYKPFRNPSKFDGLLPVLWKDGGDVIYSVPRRSRSLAHVIGRDDLPRRTPGHGLDIEPVRSYVAALENPAYPMTAFTWRNHHSAVMEAPMDREQILSVQVSYHPGWSAVANGRPVRVFADKLGQLAVEPECSGPCRVELRYDGGLERRLTVALSLLAMGSGVAWMLVDWRRRMTR